MLTPRLKAIARAAALDVWRAQRVDVVGRGHPMSPGLTEHQAELVYELLDRLGLATVLFVPLGAGRECLGNLVLARAWDGPAWTGIESAAALDIGHDVGRAVLDARTFEREHQLVEELQALDAYRTRLISTVSH